MAAKRRWRNAGLHKSAPDRKKLLQLLDAQNTLLAEARLSRFTAGFKLALGIIGELGASYSFEADELTANEVNAHA